MATITPADAYTALSVARAAARVAYDAAYANVRRTALLAAAEAYDATYNATFTAVLDDAIAEYNTADDKAFAAYLAVVRKGGK